MDAAAQPLVWWTDQTDCRRISGLKGTWPPYLRNQYRSRLGRGGRGRLWVDRRFGDVAIDPWPETALSPRLGESCAGIVIAREDLSQVAALPGVVTDLALKPVLPIDLIEEIAKLTVLAMLSGDLN